MDRSFFDMDDLRAWTATTLGRSLASVTRLRGGTKKGVYRLELERGPSVVLYAWRAEEDFWPAPTPDGPLVDRSHPFSPASGADLFVAANAQLHEIGVRTPAIIYQGRGTGLLDGDLVVVDDLGGTTLEVLLRDDPVAAVRSLGQLRDALSTMALQRRARPGKVGMATTTAGLICERLVTDRARADLAEVVTRVETLAVVHDRLRAELDAAAANVRPRVQHSLIHGELGPDHVLVDGSGAPFLIDIEGLMFFDVEWEHAFLEMRFHAAYEHLRIDGLDEDRLHLYRLALHLSLVAGPLRLLDGDFPDRAFMQRIIDHNIGQVLRFAG